MGIVFEKMLAKTDISQRLPFPVGFQFLIEIFTKAIRKFQHREDQVAFSELRSCLSDATVDVEMDLQKYTRSALIALEFYNKNHKGANFKLVGIISANSFFSMGVWEHINFNASQDDQFPKMFFAELTYGEAHWGKDHKRASEGEVTACCLLKRSTKDYCGFCPGENKIYHPLRGFTVGIRW